MQKILVLLALAMPAIAGVVYSSLPSPVPPNVPSEAYDGTSTLEFGQGIQLAGNAGAVLTGAKILMSDWAIESTYEAPGTSLGYFVPMTLSFYNVGAGNSVGSLIGSVSASTFILWRPEASAGCGTAWRAGDNNCYNGFAQVVDFQVNNLAVPSDFIYGLRFNSLNRGGASFSGPLNSLNIGLSSVAPSVGSDLIPGDVYWDTKAGRYADGGAGGSLVFRIDTGWSPYTPGAEFDAADAVPEPGT